MIHLYIYKKKTEITLLSSIFFVCWGKYGKTGKICLLNVYRYLKYSFKMLEWVFKIIAMVSFCLN